MRRRETRVAARARREGRIFRFIFSVQSSRLSRSQRNEARGRSAPVSRPQGGDTGPCPCPGPRQVLLLPEGFGLVKLRLNGQICRRGGGRWPRGCRAAGAAFTAPSEPFTVSIASGTATWAGVGSGAAVKRNPPGMGLRDVLRAGGERRASLAIEFHLNPLSVVREGWRT